MMLRGFASDLLRHLWVMCPMCQAVNLSWSRLGPQSLDESKGVTLVNRMLFNLYSMCIQSIFNVYSMCIFNVILYQYIYIYI